MTAPARWCSDGQPRPHDGRPSVRFKNLAYELDRLGEEATADPKVLTDLRALRRYLAGVIKLAEADSPVVAQRKRQGRISYLEGELARLRGASS